MTWPRPNCLWYDRRSLNSPLGLCAVAPYFHPATDSWLVVQPDTSRYQLGLLTYVPIRAAAGNSARDQ